MALRRHSAGGPANESGDMLKQLMQLGMMSQAGEKGKAPGADAALGMMVMSSMFGGSGGGGAKPVHYTRGQTVAIGPETFLVTYRYQPQQSSLMELALKAGAENKEPDVDSLLGGSLKEDSELSLALVNVRSIGALTDFRPFDLKRELELLAKTGGGGLMELFAQGFKEGLAGAEGAGAEGGAVTEPADPATVVTAVRKALAEDVALKKAPNRITVTVEDGEVILSGTATSRFMQERAALIAEQTVDQLPGFYLVENRLAVRAPRRK